VANDDLYFSDRELGQKPRTVEKIPEKVWGGIAAAIRARLSDGSFGNSFPEECPDGAGIYGCDENMFMEALAAEMPEDILPLHSGHLPSTLSILDLIEFCHRHVARPVQGGYHQFFKHHHLTFEPEDGQDRYRQDINRIFSRNGMAYKLKNNGQIMRLAPPVLEDLLIPMIFQTGDSDLNSLLESARSKFLSPDPTVRRESLEKLWDAWERIKTIEPGADKKASMSAMLEKISPEINFRERLDKEALELTSIGNNFRIRHSETNQTPLQLSEHVDYLFHRMFSLVHLMLKVTGRGG
jgi:hypothetical protein